MKKWLIIPLICFVLCCCQRTAGRDAAPGQEALAAPAATEPSAASTAFPTPSPTAAPTHTPTAAPTIAPTRTPEPTASPTPKPTDTPTPEPTKDPNRPMVALTFDDGPHSQKTAPLLDLLEKHHAKATFFVLGTSINEETAPLLQRMADMGCEIGIHGLTHGKIDKLIPTSLEKKLLDMSAIISGHIEGGYTPTLLRPPGGHFSQTVKSVTKELGLSIIMWSVDTEDWRNGLDKVLQILTNQTKDGSIILCHDKGHATQEALEVFIPMMIEKGYDFVTVTELLTRHGTAPEPGAVYLCMDP